jgi:hypothetical protein
MRASGLCSGEEGVSFQVIKTLKQSTNPDFEEKKNRVLELYDIADPGHVIRPGDQGATLYWFGSTLGGVVVHPVHGPMPLK